MKQIQQFILFSFFISILFSCEFQLDSENFVEITPPDSTAAIQIRLSPFETEYVFTVPTLVNYDLNTFGLTVYNVAFFVGEQQIHSGNEAVGQFVFEPSPWGIGEETMKMVVTTNSNTGSIADLTGAEGLVFQHSWNVLLDGGNPNPVEITTVFNDNGVLKIEWEEYNRFNFQKYILYKNFGEVEWEGEKHVIAEITNPAIHEFEDLSFVGGTGIYWIEVYASNQKATSQTKRFEHLFPKLDTVAVDGRNAEFKWNKNPFYKAVDKVTVTTPSHLRNEVITLFSSENKNDTSCIAADLRFGTEFDYTLSFFPKSNIEIYMDNQVVKSNISFGIGKSSPKFQTMLCDRINNLAYFSDNESIIQYDIVAGEVVQNVVSNNFSSWSVSAYDQSLLTQLNSNMTSYNRHDLNEKQVINCYDFGFHWFWSNANITQQNTIIGPVGFGLGLYDRNQGKLIFTKEDNESLNGCILSADGKYAFQRVRADNNLFYYINLYDVSENGFQLIKKIVEDRYRSVSWMADSNCLLLLNGEDYDNQRTQNLKVEIFDVETLSEIREFQVIPGNYCGIDPKLKWIAFWDEFRNIDDKQNIYFYNYESGKQEKTVNVSPEINGLCFCNSFVFSSEGFYMNVREN